MGVLVQACGLVVSALLQGLSTYSSTPLDFALGCAMVTSCVLVLVSSLRQSLCEAGVKSDPVLDLTCISNVARLPRHGTALV